MKTALLVALLATALSATAWADPPADAPLVIELTPAQAVAAAQRIKACEAERAELIKQFPATPWWVVVLVGVASVGAGVGLGYGIAKAAK